MNRLCYAILLLLLLTSPIAAQDDTTPFPVLDEAAIFADGVTVIERLPVLNFDNEARELYYYDVDSEQWQTHDYPSDLPTIRSIKQRSDGTSLIYTEDSYTFNSDVNPEYVWLFDPDSGLTRPPAICNLVQALPDEGEWRFTQLDGEESYRFCNTETGEHTAPLPQEIVNGIYIGTVENSIFVCKDYWTMGYKPVTSPDGDWIIFEQCSVTVGPFHTIYSYEIATDTINRLELLGPVDYVMLIDWLDNTTPVFRTGDFRTGASHSFFKLDITQADSLVELSRPLYAHIPINFDNPIRSYSVRGIRNSENDFSLAGWQVTEYLFETGESRVVVEYRFHEPSTSRETGFVLFADEKIIAVQSGYPLGTYFPLYVFNIETGELLYENERTTTVYPVANDAFVFYDYDLEREKRVLRNIQIEAYSVQDTILVESDTYTDDIVVSPDGLRFIFFNQGYYSLYNLETDEIMPFATRGTRFEWLSNSDILVSVSDAMYQTNCQFWSCLAEWHIRIDALDEEQS